CRRTRRRRPDGQLADPREALGGVPKPRPLTRDCTRPRLEAAPADRHECLGDLAERPASSDELDSDRAASAPLRDFNRELEGNLFSWIGSPAGRRASPPRRAYQADMELSPARQRIPDDRMNRQDTRLSEMIAIRLDPAAPRVKPEVRL